METNRVAASWSTQKSTAIFHCLLKAALVSSRPKDASNILKAVPEEIFLRKYPSYVLLVIFHLLIY